MDKNGNKLDLDYCSNTTIEYDIPVTIDENEIYKYDPNSLYYNDICYPSESDDGIDKTLYDRKYEYNENDLSLCQAECIFKKYDSETKNAICECGIKKSFDVNDIFNVDKKKLLKNFINIKNILNIEIIKCYQIIFRKNCLLKNYGSFILLIIIIISIICSIITCSKDFNKIKIIIQKIIKGKNSKNKNKTNKKLSKEVKRKKNINIINYPPKNSKKKRIKSIQIHRKKPMTIKSSKRNINNVNIITNKNNKAKKPKNLNDYEKNNLSFKKATKHDKRTYIMYYFSLLKQKQLIIFSFILSSDYNLKSIKINLFFLTFALNLTVNALFFNDSTMHKIYENQGNYDFLYQLPQIIYSLLISIFIKNILSILSLTEKDIVNFKEQKKVKNNTDKYEKFINYLKIRIALFLILEFIFLGIFWYYISCFCALYRNSQFHLIKDTSSSFALSLFYPFIINLIPGIFRIPSLNKKNSYGEYLYKISKFLQIII